ncbi:MAG: hypothetical protein AB2421_08965 [Thermotaleaceae bacterium]
MMNINCSLQCFFQNDGKCTLTHIRTVSTTPHPQCVHYMDKNTYLSFLSNRHELK